MTFANKVKDTFDSSDDETINDSGQIVAIIIMIAGFAIIALLAINWLDTAALSNTADTSTCIESSNAYSEKSSTAGSDCFKGNGEIDSFKTDKGYVGRST